MTQSKPPADLPPIAVRVLATIGRGCMAAGALLLLFAAFQLWGTGLSEARAQDELTARFEALRVIAHDDPRLEDAATVGPVPELREPAPLIVSVPDRATPAADAVTDPDRQPNGGPSARTGEESAGETGGRPYPEPAPAPGDPIGILHIPAIDLTKTIAEGTSRDVLRSGPGHYGSTPLPGQSGNVAIAGHRTTHGAPFLDIDQLQPGDEITVETVDGNYTYSVEGQIDDNGDTVGHRIVRPEDVEVIMDQGDDRITLTACHPKYSARQRIIVTAVLTSAPPPAAVASAVTPSSFPVPEPTTETGPSAPVDPTPEPVDAASPADAAQVAVSPSGASPSSVPQIELPDGLAAAEQLTEAESLGWQTRYLGPTARWVAVTAAVALLAAVVGRLWRRFPAYAMAVPPFTLSLYYCFVNLERLIPAV